MSRVIPNVTFTFSSQAHHSHKISCYSKMIFYFLQGSLLTAVRNNFVIEINLKGVKAMNIIYPSELHDSSYKTEITAVYVLTFCFCTFLIVSGVLYQFVMDRVAQSV